ncbi:MAG: hypothetical protein ACR2P1_28590 [Pseudomonadales bacterium]
MTKVDGLVYIRKLETQLQQEKDERNFIFNHPLLRILRGFRNLKSKRFSMGWNDIKVSSRQIVKGRKIKYSKVKRRPVNTTVSVFDEGRSFDYPELFLNRLVNERQVLIIGSRPASVNDESAIFIRPDDYTFYMSLHPKSKLVVNLEDGLLDSEWEGLFSFNRMRLTKTFSNICKLSRTFAIDVVVLCHDFGRYPLLTEFLEVVSIQEVFADSDDGMPSALTNYQSSISALESEKA